MANDTTGTNVTTTAANSAGVSQSEPAVHVEPPKDEPKEEKPERKYTDADVDEIVKKRLARAQADWESKVAKERKEATEAERLKGMNDLERATHERERLEKENAALIEQINMQEQMEVARETLAESGIHFPNELLKMFVSPDADKTKASVDAVKSLWATEVDKAVKEALRQQPPKSPNPASNKTPSAGKSFAEAYNNRMQGGK